jgi:hypothetical protein
MAPFNASTRYVRGVRKETSEIPLVRIHIPCLHNARNIFAKKGLVPPSMPVTASNGDSRIEKGREYGR